MATRKLQIIYVSHTIFQLDIKTIFGCLLRHSLLLPLFSNKTEWFAADVLQIQAQILFPAHFTSSCSDALSSRKPYHDSFPMGSPPLPFSDYCATLPDQLYSRERTPFDLYYSELFICFSTSIEFLFFSGQRFCFWIFVSSFNPLAVRKA